MLNTCSRRNLLGFASTFLPMKALGLGWSSFSFDLEAGSGELIADAFPAQSPELIREMVTVSHFDLRRVRELVEARPSLARAAHDWGFGDWEDALGAASHVGNRPIAEYLISKGARPTMFSAAMLGQLDVVKAYVTSVPGVERIRGPHSIPLLSHAKAGGAQAGKVYDYLQSLGDADSDAEVPLSDGEKTRLLGTYNFGLSANQRVDVTLEGVKTKQLTWTRRGKVGRPLYYLGNSVFYPAGAPDVRIRFAEERNTMVMNITDPNVVLTAKRI